MLSDSIPKGIRIREFNQYTTNATARLKSFPGATSKELAHCVLPTIQKESFNSALIHIGINDILKDQSDSQCESLTRNILEMSQKCKQHDIGEIIILSLVVTENINLNLLDLNIDLNLLIGYLNINSLRNKIVDTREVFGKFQLDYFCSK